jgi:hypothetical protein
VARSDTSAHPPIEPPPPSGGRSQRDRPRRPRAWLGHWFTPCVLVPYQIDITGENFYPRDSVTLYVNNRRVAKVWADDSGRFATTIEVQLPPGTEPTVTAISNRGGGVFST